jgi:GTP cyclohydrolase IA
MDLATVRKARAEAKESRVSPRPEAEKSLIEAYRRILDTLQVMGYPTKTDDNFAETAERAARAMLELIKPVAEIQNEVDAMIERTFPARYDEMVISKHNICFGMCPHHLLPVIYRISVAYLPGERVLGISKLSRLVHLLARRPVLQEDMTHELAELLHERLGARGSAAYVEGLHLCMASRGVEAHEARVVTSAVRGVFRDLPATRQEFLDLVTAPQMNLL